jgi:hypothetical protein
MSDSETLSTLALIRKAKQDCANAQLSSNVPPPQKTDLVQLYWSLGDLEGILIVEDLTNLVGKLAADADNLQGVCNQLQVKIAEIQAVANDVQAVVTAVNALIQVVTAAAKFAAL